MTSELETERGWKLARFPRDADISFRSVFVGYVSNEFYGGEFSSHTLSNLIELADKESKHVQTASGEEPAEASQAVKCNAHKLLNVRELAYRWSKHATPELQEKLLKLSRRFSIDLCPNVFYSRGSFIELLISSDVGKYSEFRLVSRILARNEHGNLEKVISDLHLFSLD